MWLLNARTYELEDFIGSHIPPYTILSHRWGSAGDEVTFQELKRDQDSEKDTWEIRHGDSEESLSAFRYRPSKRITRKKGWTKVVSCCVQTLMETARDQQAIQYTWVDTCCIDKSSSADLSEAINSMYRWYQTAEVCFAFLADVQAPKSWEHSNWWSRGWTLQELIAPKDVVFFDCAWRKVATRNTNYEEISEISGIDHDALRGTSLQSYSIATKMSWAALRETSREEDRAYSLLGIFDVNMPLLYGEGSKAFYRLQVELIRSSDDLTILAWTWKDSTSRGALAPSPSSFYGSYRHVSPTSVEALKLSLRLPREVTNVLDEYSFAITERIPCEEGTAISNLGISISVLLLQYSRRGFFVPLIGPPEGSQYFDLIGSIGFLLFYDNLTNVFIRLDVIQAGHVTNLVRLIGQITNNKAKFVPRRITISTKSTIRHYSEPNSGRDVDEYFDKLFELVD